MAQADNSNKIGVVPATLMVAGNMMGSGVFMLPANLAGIGSIALFGWLSPASAPWPGPDLRKLAAIDPAAGGPYAYARKAFGDYMGYQTNLIYWLANVVGNVGLAVAGIGYLTHFFPALKNPLNFALSQIFVIWLFTYANMLGPKLVGRVAVGDHHPGPDTYSGHGFSRWFWFSKDVYMAGWNVTGHQ